MTKSSHTAHDGPPTIGLDMAKYPVITICGSSRFKDDINEANRQLTLAGHVVISLGLFGHADAPESDWSDNSPTKRMLDDIHRQKIDMADWVYVVNPGGYIGESTRREITYAEANGKRVRYMEPPVTQSLRAPDGAPWYAHMDGPCGPECNHPMAKSPLYQRPIRDNPQA